MIISETPFRVSFLGGGTDYPEYFREHGGAVLGTAIDKFAYHSVTRFYSKLFDYNIRLAYREVECVRSLEEIRHSPFRECLRRCNVNSDVEVDYTAELPSYSGIGSSSTFVVGLLNALHAYQGRHITPLDLAYEAIHLERDVLREAVGWQDQTLAAVGGFNLIEFKRTEEIIVHRVPLSRTRCEEFQAHLLLLFTGIHRRASDVAARQVGRIHHNQDRLLRMSQLVEEGYELLTGSGELSAFGPLLHEAWTLKSQLDEAVSNSEIGAIYRAGMAAGALGGKLLGAGGGGFMLFYVPPERREAVRSQFPHLQEIAVHVDAPASRIIHG